MKSARRVSLFEREIHIRLSRAAIDLLFASASILSEGQVENDQYFGSTMLTIDIARMGAHFSESCDLTTARNAEILIARDVRVHERAHAIAIAEASRLAGGPLHGALVDVKARRAGRCFYIDVDLEAGCGMIVAKESTP